MSAVRDNGHLGCAKKNIARIVRLKKNAGNYLEGKMSIVKIDSEDVATIKNALRIIELIADNISEENGEEDEIIKQVKRINKLLPKIKFEGEVK